MMIFNVLAQAVTAYAISAAETLRQHGLIAGMLTLFFHTNRTSRLRMPIGRAWHETENFRSDTRRL